MSSHDSTIAPGIAPEAESALANPAPRAEPPADADARVGVMYALMAYGWWGLIPIYFKAVAHVPPLHVLGHRIVWSLLLLLPIVMLRGRITELLRTFRHRDDLARLSLTALLIAGNWLVFIYAVCAGHLLQCSLGYFINPLVSVLLGFIFLGERLRPMQLAAVLLALLGVLAFVVVNGEAPQVALFLAITFGFYGLLRKTAGVDGLLGLTVETALLTPIALAFLLIAAQQGQQVFLAGDLRVDLLLLASGVVTALPLLWFTNGARRLRLTTMGFLQYTAPSMHLLLALLVFHEVFRLGDALAFAFIWVAVGVYSFDAWRSANAPRRAAHAPTRTVGTPRAAD